MKIKTVFALFTLLALDRMLKIIVLKELLPTGAFFNFYPRLAFHKNFGIAFDILLPRVFVVTVSVALVLILVFFLIKTLKERSSLATALALILVGATANLYDRVVYGYVIDTIELFPRSVWNIADFLIVLGILRFVFSKKPPRSDLRRSDLRN